MDSKSCLWYAVSTVVVLSGFTRQPDSRVENWGSRLTLSHITILVRYCAVTWPQPAPKWSYFLRHRCCLAPASYPFLILFTCLLFELAGRCRLTSVKYSACCKSFLPCWRVDEPVNWVAGCEINDEVTYLRALLSHINGLYLSQFSWKKIERICTNINLNVHKLPKSADAERRDSITRIQNMCLIIFDWYANGIIWGSHFETDISQPQKYF
jgi:hypothetical protein